MTRTITIEPVLNGFICQVGCQRVVFTHINDLCVGLQKYYANPNEVEAEWISKAVNNVKGDVPCGPPIPEPYAGIGRIEQAVCDQNIKEQLAKMRNPVLR